MSPGHFELRVFMLIESAKSYAVNSLYLSQGKKAKGSKVVGVGGVATGVTAAAVQEEKGLEMLMALGSPKVDGTSGAATGEVITAHRDLFLLD